jgi:hypothetical protein
MSVNERDSAGTPRWRAVARLPGSLWRLARGLARLLPGAALVALLVSLVPLFSFGFGVYQYVQQTKIEPLNRPPVLSLSADLEEVGRKDTVVALRANIKLTNMSDRRVRILSSWYNIEASRLSVPLAELDNQAYSDLALHAVKQNNSPATARAIRHSADPFVVIASGKILPERNWFDTKEEFSLQYVFYIPENRYDLVRLTSQISLAKEDERLCTQWWPDERGGIWSFHYERRDPDPSCEELSVRETDAWQTRDTDRTNLEKKYGLASTNNIAEFSLWALPKK